MIFFSNEPPNCFTIFKKFGAEVLTVSKFFILTFNLVNNPRIAAVYQFQNEFIDAEQARNAYLKLEAIHDARIADKDIYAEQYSASWENVKAQYAAIEAQIFDCNY